MVEHPDDVRYRQLMADIARGSGVGWLRRGRAMRAMKKDRLYLQSGATTFRKWADSVFSVQRIKAALAEMAAADVYDEAVSRGLSPPPTINAAAAIGDCSDPMAICEAATEFAKDAGRDVASEKDYYRAIFEYLQPDVDITPIAKQIADGRRLNVMAAKVNSVIREIEEKKSEPGYKAIAECWHQIGAFLRRSWAAIRSSVPWAVCPKCLGAGCKHCSGRGWVTRFELQTMLQNKRLSDVEIRASKLITTACKYAQPVVPSYAFARKMGLQVCVRCCAPVRYGAACDRCTARSRSGISKNQIALWVKIAQDNISRDPERALEYVEDIATAAEAWTGEDVGFDWEKDVQGAKAEQ